MLMKLLIMLALLVLLLAPAARADGYFHTDGNRIVDAAGNPVKLNGMNWFGFETGNHVPHGLWSRGMDSFLDQLQQNGFNLLRIPWSDDLFKPGVKAESINLQQNPDLKDLTPLQVLDELVARAARRKMRIILDRHRPDSNAQSELWYTDKVSEETWIADWKAMAQRYRGNATVIGADLHNEPHGKATWGAGDRATDWRLAAERAGNAVLNVEPQWLVIVEGVERVGNDGYWWGGNLSAAAENPVRLHVEHRLVYSAHDYGPGVSAQPWFQSPDFPKNLPALWDRHWGYLSRQKIAPVLIGEFGGRATDHQSPEGIWQNALVDYINANGIYWTYWCLNPNSGDTAGLLKDDWQTIDAPKQQMLDRLIRGR